MTSRGEHKIEVAREGLLDAVEDLAELGWDEDQIRDEFEHALVAARDDGLLPFTKPTVSRREQSS